MGKSIHRMIFFFLTNYAIATRVQTLVVYYFQRMQVSGKSQFRGKALSKNWNRSYLINLLFFSTPLFCFVSFESLCTHPIISPDFASFALISRGQLSSTLQECSIAPVSNSS